MPRSHTPPERPEFFIDRSLGKHALPNSLREAGFVAYTLADVYGEAGAQTASDEEWIAHAGRTGLVVLTKDDAIRRRPAELDAVNRNGVRMFCLTNAHLRGDQQCERFLSNIHRIAKDQHGPVHGFAVSTSIVSNRSGLVTRAVLHSFDALSNDLRSLQFVGTELGQIASVNFFALPGAPVASAGDTAGYAQSKR